MVAAASDHSFTKGSCTPSVNLFMTVPNRIDASWPQGQVMVTVNDSVFEKSDGWTHAAQLCLQLIRRACTLAHLSEIDSLCKYVDLDSAHKAAILSYVDKDAGQGIVELNKLLQMELVSPEEYAAHKAVIIASV